MPLGTYDHFKAAFGTYDSAKVADWRAYADVALSKLADGVASLHAITHDEHSTYAAKLLVHQTARGVAFGKESAQAAQACKEYKQVADAAQASLKRLFAALIASPPDEDGMTTILALQNGPATIDGLIARLEGKANSKAKQDLVVLALKKRFDIKSITGDLSTKAMPRLYALLQRLPDDHTVNNAKLKEIVRSKERGASSYKRGEIVINATTVGMRGRSTTYKTDTGTHSVKSFDAMTLHEVGHSMDDKLSIMSTSAPAKEICGAWREENIDSVISAADEHLGFAAAFPSLSDSFRKKLLNDCVTGEVPKGSKLSAALSNLQELGYATIAADPGFKHAHAEREKRKSKLYYVTMNESFDRCELPNKQSVKGLVMEAITKLCQDEPAPSALQAVQTVFAPVVGAAVDWDAVGKHAAVKWLVQIGATDEGNWREKDAELRRRAVDTGDGKRVFQQSYSNVFWSYLYDARAHIVRNYQFRAEGEWFAEVYAMYFMGLMGSDHATYGWLNGLFGPPPKKMS